MHFIIASKENDPVAGGLLYTWLSEEMRESTEKHIRECCNQRLLERFKDNKEAKTLLERELTVLQKSNMFADLCLMEETAKISKERGYLVMPNGSLAGSLAAYLLDISTIDPLVGTGFDLSFEVVWNRPSFELWIAPSVRKELKKRLERKFKYTPAGSRLYIRIPMPDSDICEQVGKCAKKARRIPCFSDFDEKVCMHVAERLIQDAENESERRIEGDLQDLERCDFLMLVQLFGYLKGSFKTPKKLSDLNDPHKIVLRDELYREMISCGVPGYEAADLSYSGIWPKGKQKTLELLANHNASDDLLSLIQNTENLWPAGPCISRLQLLCALAWYELNRYL